MGDRWALAVLLCGAHLVSPTFATPTFLHQLFRVSYPNKSNGQHLHDTNVDALTERLPNCGDAPIGWAPNSQGQERGL